MRAPLALLLPLTLLGCGSQANEAGPAQSAPPTFTPGHAPRSEPPANVVGGFSFAIPETTLAPGEESFPCMIYPLTVDGPSHLVGGAKLNAGLGMHHGNITTRPSTGEGVRPCPPEEQGAFGNEAVDIVNGGAVLFASSTQVEGEEWQSFPDGMGFRVREGFEIVARMHFLNSGAVPLTLAPSYEFFTVDEALVETELGPFAWVFQGFEIPPKSDYTVEAECKLPAPMNVVHVLPHMHALGTAFQAAFLGGPLDGTRFLDSPGYDPEAGVMLQYEPAVDLSQGDGMRFGCSWRNPSDQAIGEGVGVNEMCILFGYAWPPEQAYSVLASGGNACVALAPPSE
jgi:hypothetical protein